MTNNVIDLGENVYWITRNQGYFYSNGEVIRYDAVQYNVTGIGNVWISNNQEYQNYFAALPFNGKIYPTGLLRIYSVPYYEIVNGITKLKTMNLIYKSPLIDEYAFNIMELKRSETKEPFNMLKGFFDLANNSFERLNTS